MHPSSAALVTTLTGQIRNSDDRASQLRPTLASALVLAAECAPVSDPVVPAVGEEHVSRQGRPDTRIRVSAGIAGGGAGVAACVRERLRAGRLARMTGLLLSWRSAPVGTGGRPLRRRCDRQEPGRRQRKALVRIPPAVCPVWARARAARRLLAGRCHALSTSPTAASPSAWHVGSCQSARPR
jgi:hypothetical protein